MEALEGSELRVTELASQIGAKDEEILKIQNSLNEIQKEKESLATTAEKAKVSSPNSPNSPDSPDSPNSPDNLSYEYCAGNVDTYICSCDITLCGSWNDRIYIYLSL